MEMSEKKESSIKEILENVKNLSLSENLAKLKEMYADLVGRYGVGVSHAIKVFQILYAHQQVVVSVVENGDVEDKSKKFLNYHLYNFSQIVFDTICEAIGVKNEDARNELLILATYYTMIDARIEEEQKKYPFESTTYH
jgi:hypothetical protein